MSSPKPSESPPHRMPERGLAERIEHKLGELHAALEKEDLGLARLHAAQLHALVALQLADSAALDSLSSFLQAGGERDKAALARELHDSLGGILTPAKMDVAWLEGRLGNHAEYGTRMKRLSALIDQGIDLKRRIIENLRPSLLDHLGLASALQWHIAEACRAADIHCRVHIGDTLERMPPDVEIALYRVVQEGLANVTRHAGAGSVEVTLERVEGGLRLSILDNGVGMADVERSRRGAHGLEGMSHRVRSLGGTLEVHSAPDKGTRVEAFIPLK
jgi:signal transduction histidine kinase